MLGEEPDTKYINSYAKNVSNGIRYLDRRLVENYDERAGELRENYKWVDSGYKDRNGYSIYFSFYRGHLGWEGALVGTELFLRKKLASKYNEGKSFRIDENEEECAGEQVENTVEPRKRLFDKDRFCNELYDRLLFKENWAIGNKSRERVLNYMNTLVLKVKRNIDSGIKEGYLVNEEGNRIVMNSGLLDEYMNDIFVIFVKNKDGDFVNPTIVKDKTQLINEGFTKDELREMPGILRFYKEKSELIFDGDIEDFDLYSKDRLDHIIKERKFRLPTELANLNSDVLWNKVRTAVELAVRVAQRDFKHVVPMYDIKNDKIEFLMPCHINRSINEIPEVALVVSKIGQFYQVMTLLELEEAYGNARILSMPNNSWLRIE